MGFHEAGFEVVFANDIDERALESLRMNKGKYVNSDLQLSNDDIRDLNGNEIPGNIDFLIGGPPCQSFSAFGRRAGGAAGRLDARGTLFEAYQRILKKLGPKGFLFENVRGILSTNKGQDWEAICDSFINLGYKLSYRILDACDYGIPQQRERLFLVGHKLEDDFLFPFPTHGPDSLNGTKHLSLKEAFNGLKDDQEPLKELNMVSGKYGYLVPEVPPGQNYLFFTAKRGYPNPVFAYRSRFSDFLYKAAPDKPVKTIIASPESTRVLSLAKSAVHHK